MSAQLPTLPLQLQPISSSSGHWEHSWPAPTPRRLAV